MQSEQRELLNRHVDRVSSQHNEVPPEKKCDSSPRKRSKLLSFMNSKVPQPHISATGEAQKYLEQPCIDYFFKVIDPRPEHG